MCVFEIIVVFGTLLAHYRRYDEKKYIQSANPRRKLFP